jgi:hypothetical protein
LVAEVLTRIEAAGAPTGRACARRHAHAAGAADHASHCFHTETCMKSIVLWLLGVPISVIILLKLFGVY